MQVSLAGLTSMPLPVRDTKRTNAEVMRWAAQALLQVALREQQPPVQTDFEGYQRLAKICGSALEDADIEYNERPALTIRMENVPGAGAKADYLIAERIGSGVEPPASMPKWSGRVTTFA